MCEPCEKRDFKDDYNIIYTELASSLCIAFKWHYCRLLTKSYLTLEFSWKSNKISFVPCKTFSIIAAAATGYMDRFNVQRVGKLCLTRFFHLHSLVGFALVKDLMKRWEGWIPMIFLHTFFSSRLIRLKFVWLCSLICSWRLFVC